MDDKLLQEARDAIQYALDSIATAEANGYIGPVGLSFLTTTIGDLRAARMRIDQRLRRRPPIGP